MTETHTHANVLNISISIVVRSPRSLSTDQIHHFRFEVLGLGVLQKVVAHGAVQRLCEHGHFSFEAYRVLLRQQAGQHRPDLLLQGLRPARVYGADHV